MNPYFLGGIIVFILSVVVAAIAQRVTPYYGDCSVCLILILAAPWLLYMLYAYHNHWYFDVGGSFFMLVIVFAGSLLILYDAYRQREWVDPEHKGIKVGDP